MLRVFVVALAAGVLWVSWTVIGVWLTFRTIERIDLDIEAAREAIAALPDEARPSAPPVEIGQDPRDTDADPDPPLEPGGTTLGPPTTETADGPILSVTTTLPLPSITGNQLPYDPAFSTSPAIPDEAFNAFLIIGSESQGGGKRADVIILALLPQDGSAPILVSLPRDLWVLIPCWNKPNRINAALNGCGSAASGPELLAITVAEFTGIQPDHFALFDFEDFKKVIDAFGGIEICVEYAVREPNSDFALPVGCSVADGETALGWVRSRRTQEFRDGAWRTIRGVSDLTRNERQRDVLLLLLGKVKSLDTLTSLVDIVESIADAVTIDNGITIGRAISMAWDLRHVSPDEIAQVTIPVRYYTTETGAAVLLPRTTFAEVLAEYWPG